MSRWGEDEARGAAAETAAGGGMPETLRNEETVQDRREEELARPARETAAEDGAPDRPGEASDRAAALTVPAEEFDRRLQGDPQFRETVGRLQEEGKVVVREGGDVHLGPLHPGEVKGLREAEALRERPAEHTEKAGKGDPKSTAASRAPSVSRQVLAFAGAFVGQRVRLQDYTAVAARHRERSASSAGDGNDRSGGLARARGGEETPFREHRDPEVRRFPEDRRRYSLGEQAACRERPGRTRPEGPSEPGEREPGGPRRDRPERPDVSLRRSEVQTLYDAGRFRAVRVEDLARVVHGGDRQRLAEDLRSLRRQGLVRHEVFHYPEKLETVSLTRRGEQALRELGLGEGAALYSGAVRKADVKHESAVYAAYHRERAAVEAGGGRVTGMALERELKSRVAPELNRLKEAEKKELAGCRSEAEKTGVSGRFEEKYRDLAGRHGVAWQGGKIAYPDLQVECEGRDGSTERVNIEVTTEDYRAGHVAAKSASGFRLHSAEPGREGGGGGVEPELAAEMVSV